MWKKVAYIFIGVFVVFMLFGVFMSLGEGLSQGKANAGYVEISGPIVSSRRYVSFIERLEEDPRIKGILLRIESPGGGVAASQEIFDALLRFKEKGKPIVASMGAVAASGGYYVACAADKIVAEPGTVTGSIGVIVEIAGVEKLLDKLGVRIEVIKSGKHKDIGSPFRPMTEEERKLLKGVVMDIYDQFVEAVSTSRGIPIDSIRALADGRLFSGRQALKLGLVDTLGDEKVAEEILKEMAGIEGEVRFLRQKRPFRLIDFILGESKALVSPFKVLYRMEVGS